jgi:hypothetical protein
LATNPQKITESKYNYFSADVAFINTELRSKAEKLQLWTVNKVEEMLKSIDLEASYIQTDNIPMAVFFKKIINKEIKDTILTSIKDKSGRGEFINLITLDSKMFSQNYILEVDLKELKHQSTISYVISGRNSKGEGVFWEGVKLNDSNEHKEFHFINSNKLIDLDCTQLKIYLWNREKEEVSFDRLLVRKYYF